MASCGRPREGSGPDSLRFYYGSDEMNGLRAAAVEQIIETLKARRSGARDSLEVMKLRDARQLGLYGIARGEIRRAILRERNRDVNVIRGRSLRLAGLARREFGTHAHFGTSPAGILRGEYKFARDIADRYVGNGDGFFLAACRE